VDSLGKSAIGHEKRGLLFIFSQQTPNKKGRKVWEIRLTLKRNPRAGKGKDKKIPPRKPPHPLP
jgi:hypothetical protein